MVFVFFGCEGNCLRGSVDYVTRYEEDLRNYCIAYLNLDAISGATDFYHNLWVSDDMKDFMMEAAEVLRWGVDVIAGVEVNFIYYATFSDLNIPNVWAFTYPPDSYILSHGKGHLNLRHAAAIARAFG